MHVILLTCKKLTDSKISDYFHLLNNKYQGVTNGLLWWLINLTSLKLDLTTPRVN